MFKKALIATFVLCGATPAAWSQATLISNETGVEASTDFVSVPGSAYGPWSFTPCSSCESIVLRLDDKTQFFVGKQAVPLATLRKYAARGASHLDVYYETKTRHLSRLILRTQLDPVDVPAKQSPKAKAPQSGATESRTKS